MITRLADLDVAIGVASEGAPRSRTPGALRDTRALGGSTRNTVGAGDGSAGP